MSVHLVIPGRPKPGERAGSRDGQRFSRPNTKAVQRGIGMEWIAAGRPPRTPGPVAVRIRCVYARPGRHFLAGGGLSSKGLREPFPVSSRADLDNLAKPVLDGLRGLAWVDDRQVCELAIAKVWDDGRGERTEVWIAPMLDEAEVAA